MNLLKIGKVLRKGKYIANGRTSKAVKSLVLISDHEEIFRLTARGQQSQNALLDIVRILIFIDQHIAIS